MRYEVGFARSDSLKVYVASTVSEESLYLTWLRQSLPAIVVFLLGLAAVAIFRAQLYAALRRQQLYVAQQEYRAKHDALTGLLNREGFMQLLEKAIAGCSGGSIAVVLLDLNRFKDINDTHWAMRRATRCSKTLASASGSAAARTMTGTRVARLGATNWH